MMFLTLVFVLFINFGMIKIYTEFAEQQFRSSTEEVLDDEELEEIVAQWTVQQDAFVWFSAVDGILCISAFVIISRFFTGNLAKYIMEPLEKLTAGARRVQHNDLSEDISYAGDAEFENVCSTFNEMQRHILEEQEKNRKYEKARTDMIAGISHDLRTPLTAIKGTIKGMMDGVAATPEQQKKFLGAAYRRTGDMDVLLNQLFYLSKLETGNMPLSVQEVDLVEFIRAYVGCKKEILPQEKVRIRMNLPDGCCPVQIDAEQMQRIFDNLLENSMKYGEKEPVTVDIILEKEGEGGQGEKKGYCLLVRDDGVGVPEKKLPFIFEEFYRGDESRNKKEGNGLGLYIVKYLVEAMGGRVRAENAGGLCIHMWFPISSEKEMTKNNGKKYIDS